MKNILITGATGNIGREILRYLFEMDTEHQIYAGVRNIERGKEKLSEYPRLKFVEFDFEEPASFPMRSVILIVFSCCGRHIFPRSGNILLR